MKKDIKYSVFVTSAMDDDVSVIAENMGISKNEYVRYCIAQGVLGYKQSLKLVSENLDTFLDKLDLREAAEKKGLV